MLISHAVTRAYTLDPLVPYPLLAAIGRSPSLSWAIDKKRGSPKLSPTWPCDESLFLHPRAHPHTDSYSLGTPVKRSYIAACICASKNHYETYVPMYIRPSRQRSRRNVTLSFSFASSLLVFCLSPSSLTFFFDTQCASIHLSAPASPQPTPNPNTHTPPSPRDLYLPTALDPPVSFSLSLLSLFHLPVFSGY
jgi:hypothetical protein